MRRTASRNHPQHTAPRTEAARTATVACRRFQQGRFLDMSDTVAREVRVRIRMPAGPQSPELDTALLASPHDLETLVLGHALIEACGPSERPAITRLENGVFCLGREPRTPGDHPPLVRLTPDALLSAMAAFTALPGLWEGTGCFHRAGLFDPVSGAFTHTVEDVGRHNCLDRLAGHLLDLGQSPRGFAVFLTARITASMAAKAARAGFPMLVSRSAVTHTALETDSVPTLVGFTRGDRFTVFSDPAGHVAERAGGLAP